MGIRGLSANFVALVSRTSRSRGVGEALAAGTPRGRRRGASREKEEMPSVVSLAGAGY